MTTDRKRRARVPFNEKMQLLAAKIQAVEERLAELRALRVSLVESHRERAKAMLAEAGE